MFQHQHQHQHQQQQSASRRQYLSTPLSSSSLLLNKNKNNEDADNNNDNTANVNDGNATNTEDGTNRNVNRNLSTTTGCKSYNTSTSHMDAMIYLNDDASRIESIPTYLRVTSTKSGTTTATFFPRSNRHQRNNNNNNEDDNNIDTSSSSHVRGGSHSTVNSSVRSSSSSKRKSRGEQVGAVGRGGRQYQLPHHPLPIQENTGTTIPALDPVSPTPPTTTTIGEEGTTTPEPANSNNSIRIAVEEIGETFQRSVSSFLAKHLLMTGGGRRSSRIVVEEEGKNNYQHDAQPASSSDSSSNSNNNNNSSTLFSPSTTFRINSKGDITVDGGGRSGSLNSVITGNGSTTTAAATGTTAAGEMLVTTMNNVNNNKDFINNMISHQQYFENNNNELVSSVMMMHNNNQYYDSSVDIDASLIITPSWRLRDRMKTVCVGLIMSLNVGTDPPDIIKPYPCATLQCWMDPASVSRAKAKEKIGERLEKQYSKWQQTQRSSASSSSSASTSKGGQSSSSTASAPQFKYRKALDPTVEDVRAMCFYLRKQARSERILLHYNGHGVPRPTANGEIWVFDQKHMEYIPLSVSDLRQWVGKPTIVILDCSSAGVLLPFLTCPPTAETPTNTPPRIVSPIMSSINNSTSSLHGSPASASIGGGVNFSGLDNAERFQPHPQHRHRPNQFNSTNNNNVDDDADPIIKDMDTAASHWVKDTIVLCPTSEGELLPMEYPEYPADIFTSCLTTPIQMALRWFIRQNPFLKLHFQQHVGIGGSSNNNISGINKSSNTPQSHHHSSHTDNDIDSIIDSYVDSIPGQANDRKTPLGELNWIFTSVTDSIAWNVLPKPLFQRLFRQDLLVASMFRNFLLADRILRSLNCTPQSYPPLPDGVADHPLWLAWDLACETCLFNLIQNGIIGNNNSVTNNISNRADSEQHHYQQTSAMNSQQRHHQHFTSSVSSPFFSEQLTAFEVWLEYAAIHKGNIRHLQSPEQLPVVLQVLLSQPHRVRALELLRKFLQLGSWAVNQALSLGIFPYVMKLLQSSEYKTVLVNIWSSILKFDPSCQVDLVKDKSLVHFIQPLAQWAKSSSSSSPSFGAGNKIDSSSSSSSSQYTKEAAKQRTLIAFCVAATCYKYPNGQSECLRQNLHGCCVGLITAELKLREQQRRQEQEKSQGGPSCHRRASNDATRFQLLSPIALEWLCICLGNLAQTYHLAQTQIYNANAHECLITLQQDDENANVRAAATFALANLVSQVPPPTSVSSSSGSRSSSSSRRAKMHPLPSTPNIGSPAPITLGPQAFINNTRGNGDRGEKSAAFNPSFQSGGRGLLQTDQGHLQSQLESQQIQQQQMYLPSNTVPPIMKVPTVLSSAKNLQIQNNSNNGNPMIASQFIQVGGPATNALAASEVARGGLAPTPQQLQFLQQGSTLQGKQQYQQEALGANATTTPMFSSQTLSTKDGGLVQRPIATCNPSPVVRTRSQLLAPSVQQSQQALQQQRTSLTRAQSSGSILGGAATGHTLLNPLQQQQGILYRPQGAGGGVMVTGAPINAMTSPMVPPPPPVGMPIIGSPLGIGASAVGSPIVMKQMRGLSSPSLNQQHQYQRQQQRHHYQQHPQQQQPRRRPTVYEDLRRITCDLKVIESMITILADASAMVRYEVIMGFSNFVEKYLQAILVVAEDATRIVDATNRLENIVEEQNDYNNIDTSPIHTSLESHLRVVTVPRGLNRMVLERFEQCWKALRETQHNDPHPKISEAANVVVRVVHETLYDMRMESEASRERNNIDNGLTGIQEEGEFSVSGGGMDRVKSAMNIAIGSPSNNHISSMTVPRSDGPSHRLPKPNLHPLRRSISEAGVGNCPSSINGTTNTLWKSAPSLALPGRNLIDRVKAENILPKSEFYNWKKSLFSPDYDDANSEEREDEDPLNPSGAARKYQYRRNAIIRSGGDKLERHFQRLKPPPRAKPIRGFDMLLDEYDNNDEEKNEKDAYLRSDLKLKEGQVLKNTGGVKMTSILKFHPYENALVVCDNEDFVSIWDYEGTRRSSFNNGNPAETRMTSAFWLNESSTSLLFVGCDDGSARIWNGLVHDDGQVSTESPTLASSFFAIPGMEAGKRSRSGMICEWQQTTGTLIAGGNSRQLKCWNMTAEKCYASINIETDSCVTALTTAWDEDDAHAIMQNNGYRGTSPDIIVAGLSDGTLKIFDIRTPRSGAVQNVAFNATAARGGEGRTTNTNNDSSRKKRAGASLNNKTFNEHGSWIVDVSFSSFGGQNEILSGSVAGDIRAWDIRSPSRGSLRAIDVQRSPMTALSVHKRIPIAATGSHAQFIKILTLEGETLQVVRYHEESLPGHRIGPVSCLEFHKHKLVLAAGSSDAYVSIYQPRRLKI